MTDPVPQNRLADAVLKVVREVGAPINGAAIGERLAREIDPVITTGAALLATLNTLVETKHLERELLPGQRSTYRVHAECPIGPVKLRAVPPPAAAPKPAPAPVAAAPAPPKPKKEQGATAETSLVDLITEALAGGKRLTPAQLSIATDRKVGNIYATLDRMRKAGRVYKPDKGTAQWSLVANAEASLPTPPAKAETRQEKPEAIGAECATPCGQYQCDAGCVNAADETLAAPAAVAEPPVDYYEALAQARRSETQRNADELRRFAELERKAALIDSPETASFLAGVRNEVAHQVERWGTVHDRAKAPADWFWLVGYLAGKALHAHVAGDREKALHHCISTAAALANWHVHVSVGGTFTPGASDLQKFIEERFAG